MLNLKEKNILQKATLRSLIKKLHRTSLPSNWKFCINSSVTRVHFSFVNDHNDNSMEGEKSMILSQSNDSFFGVDMLMNNIAVDIPYIPQKVSNIQELIATLEAFNSIKFCSCYLQNHREYHCLIFSTPFVDICSDCLKNPDCKKENVSQNNLRKSNEENVNRDGSNIKADNTSLDCICLFCNQQFYSEMLSEHYKKHLVTDSIGRFICTFCSNVFDCISVVIKHYNSQHNYVKFIKCSTCQKKFSSIKLLQVHLKKHIRAEPFVCQNCNKKYASMSDFMKHQKEHSNKSRICKICHKKYATFKLLTQHLKEHSLSVIKCKYCQQDFLTNALLEAHKMMCNQRKLKYVCNICFKRFSCVTQKLCHVRQIHNKNIK